MQVRTSTERKRRKEVKIEKKGGGDGKIVFSTRFKSKLLALLNCQAIWDLVFRTLLVS